MTTRQLTCQAPVNLADGYALRLNYLSRMGYNSQMALPGVIE